MWFGFDVTKLIRIKCYYLSIDRNWLGTASIIISSFYQL